MSFLALSPPVFSPVCWGVKQLGRCVAASQGQLPSLDSSQHVTSKDLGQQIWPWPLHCFCRGLCQLTPPAKHHLWLELRHLCCPYSHTCSMHVDCGLQIQHLCTDEFQALFKPNLQHSTVMIKWVIPGLSFALPLPFDTLSIHQKMTFKRRFQYWTCAAPPCNEKHQMKQNSHISSEQIRFQAMQCFSSTCYPLQILMHRDMRTGICHLPQGFALR